jgi:arthrofactin-type cyclic lipopeptide synthetase C
MSAGAGFPCTVNQMMVARLQAKGYVSTVPLLLRATGQLRLDRLGDALQRVVDRHEVLRSVFTGAGDALMQTPVEHTGLAPLAITDVSHMADPLAAALDAVGADARRPFDAADPLRVRAGIFRLAADDYLVSVMIDHLAADGASLGIVTDEWRRFYRALVTGAEFEMPAAAPQYRAFALWQRAWLESDQAEELRAAWIESLEGMEPDSSPAKVPFRAELRPFDLDAKAGRYLAAICDAYRLKPFVVMLACYAALLTLATGEYDLIISTVRANRRRPDTPAMVGHFANLIPLRARVHRNWGVDKLLKDFATVTMAAYARDALPFIDLATATWRARGILASRLADISINFVPFPDGPVGWTDELKMQQLWLQLGDPPSASGRITLYVRYQSSAVGGALMYDPSAIDAAWVERFPEMLGTALARLGEGSAPTVADLLKGF